MRDGLAAIAALFSVILGATSSAHAQSVCGTPESPASCLADCGNNVSMQARRVTLDQAARSRDSEAMYQMGRSWLGQPGIGGVPVCRPTQADYQRAADWFHQAAESGHAGASVALGDYYELGQGGEKDYAKAFHWFQAAATTGHARALFRVGVFHDFGRTSAPKDETLASIWYREAAKRGSCDARFALATMFARGRGIPKNPVEAYALYDLVVEIPYPLPCYGKSSGDARRYREQISAQMSPTDFAAARDRQQMWQSGVSNAVK